MSEKFNFSGN